MGPSYIHFYHHIHKNVYIGKVLLTVTADCTQHGILMKPAVSKIPPLPEVNLTKNLKTINFYIILQLIIFNV